MGLIVETMINQLQEGQCISFKLKHNEKKILKIGLMFPAMIEFLVPELPLCQKQP